MREACIPAIQPHAADPLLFMVSVVETELLSLGMRQPLNLVSQRITQSDGHCVMVVLAGLAGVVIDASALSTVRHVERHLAQKVRIGNLEHYTAGVMNYAAVVFVAPRLAASDPAVHAEQPQQRLEFFGERNAGRGDGDAAPLGRHRAVGVDQTGQERQEVLVRTLGDPARNAQGRSLATDLVVDQFGGASSLETGNRIVPDVGALGCLRMHDARGRTAKSAEERSVALDDFTFGGANLENQSLTSFCGAFGPGPATGLVL